MAPFEKKTDIIKAPSFSSAPALNSSIPIPSFSSAPDFSNDTGKDDSQRERKSRHDRDSSHRSSSPRRHRRERSRSSDRRHRSRSPRRRHRSRSRSPKRSRRRSRSPRSKSSRHEKSSRRKRSPSPEIVHTGTLSTGVTFVMDRRGDPDNVRYGGNHIYSIPEYRRNGGGRVLGLSPNQRIDKSAVKTGTITLVDKSNRKPARYTDKDYAWKEIDNTLKRIRITPKKNDTGPDPFAVHTGFIGLDDNSSKAKTDDFESYSSSGVDYRSLEGNKVKRYEDEEESEEEEGESFNDQVRQRTINYNRRLDKEPENVSLWLEFINFQDEAAAGLDSSSKKENKASLNEVKLSIFEKALEHNPDDEDLIHAYLTCGAETWETLKLLREWDKVLKNHPDSIKLWSDYINLRQTNFASFTFTQCVKVFEDALATLNRQARRKSGDFEARENIESVMVYILLRACLFMKQSGYHEKAFALIQATVEFNLFQPSIFDVKSSPLEDKVKAFADFWDSEVLRFGEAGAQGWHEYYRASDNGEDIPEPPQYVEEDKETLFDPAGNILQWFFKEQKVEEVDHLPLRMSQAEDEAMDEDPYRIILSDDIKPFLFNITTIGARQNLVYSIFVFLGLPYTPPEVGTNTHFFTDTFTHNDLSLENFWPVEDRKADHHLLWYVEGVPMIPEQTVNETNPYYIPYSYPVGVQELFAQPGKWFKTSGKCFLPGAAVDVKFMRNVFEQLLPVEKSEHLEICYLAFVSSYSYKMGKKLAKSLLKDQRFSLTLWNAYAQMEKSHGNLNEARKVYLTALSMYKSFPEKNQSAVPLLFHMFAKLELEAGEPNEALKILVSMADTEAYDEKTPLPTAVSILKAREYFSQKLMQVSTLSDSPTERQAAFRFVSCAGLFEYLSSDVESACLIYEHALDYIKGRQAERGYESEIIWVEYAAMLYRHSAQSNTGGYKPGVLRSAMERALKLFPNNTIFLAFYIWNESKTKIYNRVQHLLNNSLKQESNVILWLSAIYSELHRYKPFQVNSVRDFFERSITDPRTKCSIILWKYYIQFELSQNNNKERARNLFYRSIRECPWSKELYLRGICDFAAIMDKKELTELVNLMMEKEIRIRYPIDEGLLES